MALNSRQWLMILAAVIIVIAGGTFFFVNRPQPVEIQASSTPATASGASSDATATPAAATQPNSELMVAGPLGERALGDPKAPNTVIEYVSMTCPHCQRWHTDIWPEFKAKYVDTGKVYFILREFPLDTLATSAIMLVRCQPADRYFPLVDLLFDQQANWAFVQDPKTALQNLVKQAGITTDDFNACLTNQEILDGVNWVRNRASEKFGVQGTPAFFVNGVKKEGEQPMEELDKLLTG